MNELFSRNELYWGEGFQDFLKGRHVSVFGLGGVGSFCAESLVRSGVGSLTLVDFDDVSKSNINRQLLALHSTLGRKKTDVFKERLKDINPNLHVQIFDTFLNEKNISKVLDSKPDFVADAIDSFRSKIDLIEWCYHHKIPLISSMGAGNRLDPTKLYITDICDIKSKNCQFVSRILSMLKMKGIKSGINVVTSSEKPKSLKKVFSEETITLDDGESFNLKKFTPASTPFVPAVAGYLMAYYIIERFLIDYKNE